MDSSNSNCIYEIEGYYCSLCEERHEHIITKEIGKDVFLNYNDANKQLEENKNGTRRI